MLLSFKQPLLSDNWSLSLFVSNFDAKYLGNEAI